MCLLLGRLVVNVEVQKLVMILSHPSKTTQHQMQLYSFFIAFSSTTAISTLDFIINFKIWPILSQNSWRVAKVFSVVV